MTQLAGELARRTSPEYVKAQAREVAQDVKERVRTKAIELREDAKVKVREQARERMIDMRQRTIESPWVLGLVGGIAGAFIGRMIGQRARAHYDETWEGSRQFGQAGIGSQGAISGGYATTGYGYGTGVSYGESVPIEGQPSTYPGGYTGAQQTAVQGELGVSSPVLGAEEPGLKEKAQAKVEDLKEKAVELKDKAISSLPSKEEVKFKAREWKFRAEEHYALLGFGAVAIGALFGMLVPLSEREQRILGPVKVKAGEKIDELRHQAVDKAREVAHQVERAVGLEGESQQPQANGQYGEPSVGTYTASTEGGVYTPSQEPDITRH